MTTAERNFLVEEHYSLVNTYLQQYKSIIHRYGVSMEDVKQDLYIAMIDALDKYDPSRCDTVEKYLREQLRYRIYSILSPNRRLGMTGAPRTESLMILSLEQINPQSCTMYENHAAAHWLMEEIAGLPDAQRTAIYQLLYGDRLHSSNRTLEKARKQIKLRMDEVGVTIRLQEFGEYAYV